MSIDQTLLELEEQGASALTSGNAAAFYEKTLTEDALMVVPGFVIDKATFLGSISAEPAWQTFRIDVPRVIELTPDCSIIRYEATSTRAGQPDSVGLLSSTYVKRNRAWQLTYHQQTPNPASSEMNDIADSGT